MIGDLSPGPVAIRWTGIEERENLGGGSDDLFLQKEAIRHNGNDAALHCR